MDGKLGVIVGWVLCLVIVAGSWLLVRNDGMGAVVAWLVVLLLVVVCVIAITERMLP